VVYFYIGEQIMLTVIAQFSVKADKINDFLTQCQELIKHTRQETGCVSYELQQNSEQANHYVFKRHTLPQLYLYWSSIVNKRQWCKPFKKSANNDRTLINIF